MLHRVSDRVGYNCTLFRSAYEEQKMTRRTPFQENIPLHVEAEDEPLFDRRLLGELVHWVKELKDVGVSPDKAVDVATKFILAPLSMALEECCEEEDEDDDADSY